MHGARSMTAAVSIDDAATARGRRAMTLIEVLLTLCLLVLLASIAWPALDRPMANHRLRKAADVIRVEWTRARVKAMASGETLVFRYAPQTDRYAIESHAGPEYMADDVDLADNAESGSVLASTERTLPKRISFLSSETTDEARVETLVTETQQLSATESGWSDPIVFYPDGTSSTVSIVLQNEHDRTIEVQLRGLTGTVTSGKPRSGGEEFVP